MNKIILKKALVLTMLSGFLLSAPCHAEFYRYNIDELARKAKVRIEEIKRKIADEEIAKQVDKIAADLASLYEKAESLFTERKYEEAVTIYRKIDRMSRNSEILGLLKDAGK